MNQTIAEFQKNPAEKIVGSLAQWQGKQRIDIRVYFKPDNNPDNWIPTKKGINLDPDTWGDFKALIGKIDKAVF